MALNIWALSIVKAVGLDLPSVQLVTIRACTGLLLMLPWILSRREAFVGLPDLKLHLLRVAFSAATLTASFFAIARMPFALFTAIGFTRPIVMLIMAALLLKETIGRRRWIAVAIAFAGVLIAVEPGRIEASLGLAATFLTVLLGTSAVILTRRLKGAPTVVLMTFYTAGLTVLTAPFTALNWQPVPAGTWPALIGIGLFAQCAQFCFVQAHKLGEAGFLGVLGYLTLVFSTASGYLLFGEVPTIRFWGGAVLILAAAMWVTLQRGGKAPVNARA
ncbi:DMT family transporter [Pelagovum pacificum]|uniref:DMT family transporter n=1 Tax=Pelagovum pacificum TaxID=2588711 RepID=A0A5C5GAH3_9RHOB|nr:DMT family transporter [Pelagovum pacificum]QQA41695.1 DMT family transporter [Pelagovum pacificum]TNY30972.1 DMT family transporter [Pelagovum pacificum]